MSTPRLVAVLCPATPLLFRELGGLADPVAELRRACQDALGAALADRPDAVVVVGPVDEPSVGVVPPAAPDVRRFGTTGERTGPGLPLPLGVGRRLLDEAGWTGPTELRGLPVDATEQDLRALADELTGGSARTLLLLLGDGSARRDPTGPGLLDERAFAFDAGVVEALRAGDAAALAGLDVALARDLMVLGRAAFRLLGVLGAESPPDRAEVGHESDPFGVDYVVATWRW